MGLESEVFPFPLSAHQEVAPKQEPLPHHPRVILHEYVCIRGHEAPGYVCACVCLLLTCVCIPFAPHVPTRT